MFSFRHAWLLCATLAWTGGPALAADDFDPAEKFAADCAQCHGRTGRGMASFPSLRRRSADYVSERLTSYRAGEAVGPNSMLMYPVAADLTDDEIARLSTFISDSFR
jgi:cytochrome c553